MGQNSAKARWLVIDKSGGEHGPFETVLEAAYYVKTAWPDQEQDERRTGKGWDIEAVESKR